MTQPWNKTYYLQSTRWVGVVSFISGFFLCSLKIKHLFLWMKFLNFGNKAATKLNSFVALNVAVNVAKIRPFYKAQSSRTIRPYALRNARQNEKCSTFFKKSCTIPDCLYDSESLNAALAAFSVEPIPFVVFSFCSLKTAITASWISFLKGRKRKLALER